MLLCNVEREIHVDVQVSERQRLNYVYDALRAPCTLGFFLSTSFYSTFAWFRRIGVKLRRKILSIKHSSSVDTRDWGGKYANIWLHSLNNVGNWNVLCLHLHNNWETFLMLGLVLLSILLTSRNALRGERRRKKSWDFQLPLSLNFKRLFVYFCFGGNCQCDASTHLQRRSKNQSFNEQRHVPR